MSDPVDLFDGGYVLKETDLFIECKGIDIHFSRTYRAKLGHDDRGANQPPHGTAQSDPNNPGRGNGPLGNNWDHSHNIRLLDGIPGTYILQDGAGRTYEFVEIIPTFWTSNALGATLRNPLEDIFELDFGDGTIFTIRGPNAATQPGYSRGYLSAIRDRNGNVVTLTYDTQGRLATVAHSDGHVVTCTHAPGQNRLLAITSNESTPRQVIYDYYSAEDPGGNLNDLASVTQTPVEGFPLGRTWTYTYYEGTTFATNNLESIIDPNGNTVLVNHYSTS